ncbi:MAG: cysteine synthase family protein [Planctomycetota bacterium]
MDIERNVYRSVLEMLPSERNPSPMVRIERLNPRAETFPLYAKLEWQNPFGSVKDRAASSLIAALEAEGAISPERGIVEPTSGNTGLSLAAIAAAKGVPMKAVVPNKVPIEKKVLLKMLGAELEVVDDNLCPSPGMGEGSINLAKTFAKAQASSWVMPNQYENEANSDAHVRTTGPELWRQTEGKITHLFLSLGTCGTLAGSARYLKERNPAIRVVAIAPTPGHDVAGLRSREELGVSRLYDESLVDELIELDHDLAYRVALELMRTEGLLAGPSSGLIFEGARRVLARDETERGLGVAIFCDNAFKYVSSFIRHVPELAEGTQPG